MMFKYFVSDLTKIASYQNVYKRLRTDALITIFLFFKAKLNSVIPWCVTISRVHTISSGIGQEADKPAK